MRRKATFRTPEVEEVLTWVFVVQILFASTLGFLGLWLH